MEERVDNQSPFCVFPSYKVHVSCMTFNQAPYIADSMDGFCMQKTTFPFVCTIFDDASTDGEPEVIQQYLQKHFDLEDRSVFRKETDVFSLVYARHKENANCFFLVVYLKYNHYSKGIGRKKLDYVKDWTDGVPYIALCEGDDYWTDPNKLQMQVDYLDAHPDYSMCFHTVEIERDGRIIGNDRHSEVNRVYSTKKIIEAGGGFCATCSLLFRREYNEELPEFRKIAPIGDYPLQILLAIKGKVFCFTKEMGVYRSGHAGSWTANQSKESYRALLDSKLKWMDALLDYTNGEYKDSVHFSCLCSMIRRFGEGVVPFEYVSNYIKKSRINVFHLDHSTRRFYLFMYVKFSFPKLYRLAQKLFWK